ncbi:hypothetical protein BGW80DRAFT_1284371 [Lactifluus volemus]|nr:hypothetical protein BGW80DRAFT_1284371 [Lactifluus volemus]
MVSTSRSTSSSPEAIYTPATRRDAVNNRHSNRLSSDRVSKARLTSMLLYDEREANDLRRMLLSVTEQLKKESQRADDNERRAREAIQRFKAINEARTAAQQDAARATEELRLYKLQLEHAQQEIYKAQNILDSLEAQRHDAEASAAKARTVARKLKEDTLVDLAREEGRQLGLKQGLARGRRLGFEQTRSTSSDRRDSQVILNDLPPEQDHEDDVGSLTPTSVPAILVEPPLDPIGEDMLDFPPSSPANLEIFPHPEAPPPGDLPRPVTTSPSHHPHSIIPQDGFIPLASNDSVIRLPPPHEMASPVAPSSPVLERPASVGAAPLMVPDPGVRRDRAPTEPGSPGSTNISEFELVSQPNDASSRPSRRNEARLDVIPEVVSGSNTPADRARSISIGPASRPASSASSVPRVLSPSFVQANASPSRSHYDRRRSSYTSTSSSSANVTPAGLSRILDRTSSSVPDIFLEPPSRDDSQTPQATPVVSHRGLLSAEDAAQRPMSPSVSTSVLNSTSSGKVPRESSASTAGGAIPTVISYGQLPPGFVPMTVPSLSQAPSPHAVPHEPYAVPSAPSNSAVTNPRLSPRTNPRPLYGVPVQDASSSSSRSLHNPVRIPLSSTTADSSVMVPPASLFSRPNVSSSSETDEDEAVASSLASNDTLSTPPPSRKKAKSKTKSKTKLPAYDAAPTPPGQEYPSSPLVRASTLASPGPSAAPANQARNSSAGLTPAARRRTLRH